MWDGLGDEYASAPNHAIDNESGDYDMLLLQFSAPVSLKSLSIGWVQNDSDVSLLALPSGTPADPTGKVWQTLLTEGWVSAGNYYDVKQNPNVNPGDIVSKYWLVGAYNSNLGGSFLGGNQNITTGTDYFKLAGVNACVIPEPTSFVMAALGIASSAMLLRRRR